MTWDQAAAALNAATLANFGEDVTVRTAAGDTPLRAVVVRPTQKATFGGFESRAATFRAEFDAVEFAATSAGPNDAIVDQFGVVFTITDKPDPDDGGMTTVHLQPYGQP